MRAKDDLTLRIERLEREARRWRLAAVILGGLLGLVGLVGATKAGSVPVAEEIRARRFVLVDGSNLSRAEMGLSQWTLEPYFQMTRRKGGNALVAAIDTRGEPYLILAGPGDTVRSQLRTIDDFGSDARFGSLELYDGHGEFAIRAGAGSLEGGPGLTIFGPPPDNSNPLERSLAILRFQTDEAASLQLVDRSGRPRAVLGPTALERTKTGAVEQLPASSLVLLDKDGTVLFKAP